MSYGKPKVGSEVLCTESCRSICGFSGTTYVGKVTKFGRKLFTVDTVYGIKTYNISDWVLSTSPDNKRWRPRAYPSREIFDQVLDKEFKIQQILMYCYKGILEELPPETVTTISDLLHEAIDKLEQKENKEAGKVHG